jgi:O-antigen/teichoic acid export membrane protein
VRWQHDIPQSCAAETHNACHASYRLQTEGSLLSAIVAVGMLIFGSRWFTATVLNSDSLAIPLLLASPTICFLVLDVFYKSILIGLEQMKRVTHCTILGISFGLTLSILITHLYGLNGAATSLSVVAGIQALISFFAVRQSLANADISNNAKHGWTERSLIGSFALPALLAAGMVGPVLWIAQTMLASRPNGFTELAYLGIAMQWFTVIMFIPTNAGKEMLAGIR